MDLNTFVNAIASIITSNGYSYISDPRMRFTQNEINEAYNAISDRHILAGAINEYYGYYNSCNVGYTQEAEWIHDAAVLITFYIVYNYFYYQNIAVNANAINELTTIYNAARNNIEQGGMAVQHSQRSNLGFNNRYAMQQQAPVNYGRPLAMGNSRPPVQNNHQEAARNSIPGLKNQPTARYNEMDRYAHNSLAGRQQFQPQPIENYPPVQPPVQPPVLNDQTDIENHVLNAEDIPIDFYKDFVTKGFEKQKRLNQDCENILAGYMLKQKNLIITLPNPHSYKKELLFQIEDVGNIVNNSVFVGIKALEQDPDKKNMLEIQNVLSEIDIHGYPFLPLIEHVEEHARQILMLNFNITKAIRESNWSKYDHKYGMIIDEYNDNKNGLKKILSADNYKLFEEHIIGYLIGLFSGESEFIQENEESDENYVCDISAYMLVIKTVLVHNPLENDVIVTNKYNNRVITKAGLIKALNKFWAKLEGLDKFIPYVFIHDAAGKKFKVYKSRVLPFKYYWFMI